MDSLFFWFSKLAWMLVSPDSLIVILVLAALGFLYVGRQRLARHLLSMAAGLLVVIALFPVGEWLLYPLETRFETNPALPGKLDGIIVLGGSESALLAHLWDQVEVGGSIERDLAFLALARKHPGAKLVFTGGSGRLVNREYTDADVARRLFAEQDFDVRRVTFENESRNTYENAIFSKRLAQPKNGERWLLITTAWHMPRAAGIFCNAGWPVLPYPVDHYTRKGSLLRVDLNLSGNLGALKMATKEWLGLLAYRLSNKTAELLPAGCQQ